MLAPLLRHFSINQQLVPVVLLALCAIAVYLVEPADHFGGNEEAILQGFEKGVDAVAISPDGRLLVSGDASGAIRVWQTDKRKEMSSFAGHGDAVWSLAFSPDGSTLASGSRDHTAKLWDVATRSERCTLTGHTDWVRAVAFSPDG
jgi:WD40 repeat protein